MALNGAVLSTVDNGGPSKTELSLSQKGIRWQVHSDARV